MLPFDIYNEKGKKIFSEGEELTPGKILQLKYIPVIYIKEKLEVLDEDEFFEEYLDHEELLKSKIVDPKKDIPVADIKSQLENPSSVFSPQMQKQLKEEFKEIVDSFIEDGIKDPVICFDVRDKIIEEVLPQVDNILYKSQLQVFGDYNYCHGINVAMLSTVLAEKLKLSQNALQDITLAAMLHDIGKIKIPKQVLEKTAPSPSEVKLIQLHPRLGHKIILNELNLHDTIANVALQHHERNDGSGYPYGISGERISYESQVVMVCNVYDELTSGKSMIKVRNSREAIKILLEIGSKWFRTDVLYTFIHMTNYNDDSVIYSY